MTTKDDISRWFDRGVKQGNRYMLVICDTFDHDDYPVYFDSAISAKDKIAAPGQMQRFMEAYDLHADKASQMASQRANCFAQKDESHE